MARVRLPPRADGAWFSRDPWLLCVRAGPRARARFTSLIAETPPPPSLLSFLDFDDQWNHNGPSEESPLAVEACGLSPADVDDLIAAFTITFKSKINATIANGGFVFDLLGNAGETNITSAPATCSAFMRKYCGADSPSQTAPFLYEFTRVNHTTLWPLPYPEQNLATFLLARGDYAWIGYIWSNCYASYERPASLDVDYGTPLNFCSETSPGVFTRNYTKADIALDCNSYVADIVTNA